MNKNYDKIENLNIFKLFFLLFIQIIIKLILLS